LSRRFANDRWPQSQSSPNGSLLAGGNFAGQPTANRRYREQCAEAHFTGTHFALARRGEFFFNPPMNSRKTCFACTLGLLLFFGAAISNARRR